MREGVAEHFAGHLGLVVRLPVHRRRRMFHEDPRLAARHPPAGEVGAESELYFALRVRSHEVVVVGDHVHILGPIEVVQGFGGAGDHEVGGCRDVGGDLADDGQQLAVVVDEGPGVEACEVQLLPGIEGGGRGPPRWDDFLEGSVVLRPKRRTPGLVEGLDGAVSSFQPRPESGRIFFAMEFAHVAAKFVVHVPERQGRVIFVSFGEHAGHGGGVPAVHSRRRRVVAS